MVLKTKVSVALMVVFSAMPYAEVITFDEFPAMNWGELDGMKIAEEYAALGIHFIHTDDGATWDGISGGDPGLWAIEGTNGDNFLGYNGTSYGAQVLFDADVMNLSLDIARTDGSEPDNTFTINVFDVADNLIENQTVVLGGVNQWSTVTLSSNNIRSLTWVGNGANFHPYGIDNLIWEQATAVPAVPEPCSLTLLLMGAGCLAFIRRKKS